MTSKESADSLRTEVRGRFFLSLRENVLRPDLQAAVARSSAPYRNAGEAFLSSLRAAVSTLSLPETLSINHVYNMDFYREYLLASINAAPGQEEQLVACDIHQKLVQKKGAGASALARIWHFLLQADQQEECHDACTELLRQGAVLIWGAFEAFVRDVVVRFLDQNPTVALDLLESPDGRRLFGARSLDFEILRQFGFNVSERMGQVLAGFHDLSSLQSLKTTITLLFPDDGALRNAFGSRNLWLLSQRRHIIVHNRSMIDQRYLEATGETLSVGESLILSPNDVEQHLAVVQEVGVALLCAVSR